MIKILIADEEKGICDFISDFFERRGHKVVSTTNPAQVLSLMGKERPLIVILDLMLPNFKGLEILKEIKDKYPGTKVVLVTVVEDKATKEKALKLGADEYITKPFSTEYLEDIVMLKIQEILKEQKALTAK